MVNVNDKFFKIGLGSLELRMMPEQGEVLGVRVIASEDNGNPFFEQVVIAGKSERIFSGAPGSHSIDIDALVSIDETNEIVFDGSFSEGELMSMDFLLKLGLPKNDALHHNTANSPFEVKCKYPASTGTLSLNVEPVPTNDMCCGNNKKVKLIVNELEEGVEAQYGPSEPLADGQELDVSTRSRGKKHQPDFTGKLGFKGGKAFFDGSLIYDEGSEIPFYFGMKL